MWIYVLFVMVAFTIPGEATQTSTAEIAVFTTEAACTTSKIKHTEQMKKAYPKDDDFRLFCVPRVVVSSKPERLY